MYNRPVTIGEKSYVDGAMSDAFPLAYALRLGCSGLMSVLTVQEGQRYQRKSYLYRNIGRLMARGHSQAVKSRIGEEDSHFNAAMKLIEEPTHPDMPTNWVVRPSNQKQMVGLVTTDKRRLEICAEMGRQDMQSLLAQQIEG